MGVKSVGLSLVRELEVGQLPLCRPLEDGRRSSVLNRRSTSEVLTLSLWGGTEKRGLWLKDSQFFGQSVAWLPSFTHYLSPLGNTRGLQEIGTLLLVYTHSQWHRRIVWSGVTVVFCRRKKRTVMQRTKTHTDRSQSIKSESLRILQRQSTTDSYPSGSFTEVGVETNNYDGQSILESTPVGTTDPKEGCTVGPSFPLSTHLRHNKNTGSKTSVYWRRY